MPMQEEPIIGAQYEDADGLTFEVTDFDVDEGVINVRYADDSVSEIDIDAWYELELRQCKADDAEDEEVTEEKPDADDEDDYDDEEEQ